MKVLLFTHEQDIDGMGNVILLQEAFEEYNFITCKTFEVNQKVQSTIDDGSIYNYDFIYVTDICIKEPLLSKIDKDDKLRNKILIFDHHKSEIEEGNNKYSFVNIVVENEKGKTSGTSLFYEYLVDNKLLKPTKAIEELVELTRQYDTYEWKYIYNNPKARKLHILFEVLGYEKYIEIVNKMINTNNSVVIGENEEKIISNYEETFLRDVKKILNGMIIYTQNIDNENYRIGYVKCPYKYRNDINEVIIKNNVNNIDMVGMVMTDIDTVSYRLVKDKDASKVGVYFGGKGHKAAASNPQDNEKFQKVLDLFK